MPKVFTSKSQKTGELGEDIAVIYLQKQGFSIIERNHTQKWGEIDIIARKEGKIHFVEVKAISCAMEHVTRVTTYRPEENMHPKKLEKFYKTIEIYLMDQHVTGEEWQADLLCVYLDPISKKAQVKRLENI
jgi:putative endonuclease